MHDRALPQVEPIHDRPGRRPDGWLPMDGDRPMWDLVCVSRSWAETLSRPSGPCPVWIGPRILPAENGRG